MGGTTSVVSRLAFLPPKRGRWHDQLKVDYRDQLHFVDKPLSKGTMKGTFTAGSSTIADGDRDGRPPRADTVLLTEPGKASEMRTLASSSASLPTSMGPASSTSAMSPDSATTITSHTPGDSETSAAASSTEPPSSSSSTKFGKRRKKDKSVQSKPTSVRLSVLFFRCSDQRIDDPFLRSSSGKVMSSAASSSLFTSATSTTDGFSGDCLSRMNESDQTTGLLTSSASSADGGGSLRSDRIKEEGKHDVDSGLELESSSSSPELTILYSHGNAEDLATSAEAFASLSKYLRINVCAYDYEGYGLSEPRSKDFYPTEQSAFDDVQTVFNWLKNVQKIQPSRIIVFGRSLGSGPTVELASKTEGLAGCILQSPLRSAVKTQISGWMASGLGSFDIFKNDSKIDKIKSYPVMVIHGRVDKVVPFEHGEWLADKADEDGNATYVERYFVDGCGHNDIEYTEGDLYYLRIKNFIDEYIRKVVVEMDQKTKKDD